MYRIKLDEIKGRQRLFKGLSNIVLNSATNSLVSKLIKTYPKGNFLKIYYRMRDPEILISDTDLKVTKYILKKSNDFSTPILINIELIKTLEGEKFDELCEEVGNLVTSSNLKIAENIRDDGSLWRFGPKCKIVYKINSEVDRLYWRVLANRGSKI